MKLLAFYLVLTALFLISVNAGPAETVYESASQPDRDFREVVQDGTITVTRLNAGFAVYISGL